MEHELNSFKLLIGGKLVEGAKSVAVVNPANGMAFARAPCASPEQLDQAVAAASEAFPHWASRSFEDRASCLTKIADCIEVHASELASVLTREQGKPLAEATFEAMAAAAFFRYFANVRPETDTAPDGQGRQIETLRKPLGVIGAIVPWNYPLTLMAFKVPPALIAGNAVILKPAPTTPLSTLYLAQLIQDYLPSGVLNILSDDGSIGPAMTEHPGIAKISFTGSTETGKKVMMAASGTLKRLTLELGGNDAAIVLADTDAEAIADQIFQAAFGNAGQTCIAIKRLFVHSDLHDKMCDALVKRAANAIVGDGMAEDTQIGPVQNKMQYDKVRAFIKKAATEGTVIAGGQPPPSEGYFVPPTLVRDIADTAQLVTDEQFGPVLPILRFSEIEDVVQRVNASPFGLGASVWSKDNECAIAVARKLRAGTVWINKHADLMPHIPFGGAGISGIGTELGNDALDEFTQLQIINSTIS